MDHFNVLRRARGTQPPSAADRDLEGQTSDTVPLSPRGEQEMTEQHPGSLFSRLPTIRRPGMFSYRSSTTTTSRAPVRPSSSAYSGSPNPNAPITSTPSMVEDPDSPKFATSRFSIAAQRLPGPHLDLPHLTRTWTEEEQPVHSGRGVHVEDVDDNGISPISEPGESMDDRFPTVTQPSPVLRSDTVRSHRQQAARALFGEVHDVDAVDPAEVHLAELADDGRRRRDRRRREAGELTPEDEERRRRRRRRREHGHGHRGREHRHRHRHREHRDGESREEGESRGTTRSKPKRFLFCFPWIKSRRIRSHILRCFVSGSFLTLLLTVFLALSLSKNVNTNEFTILFILIILCTTIIFCHSLIRLCMLIVRPPTAEEEDAYNNRRHRMPNLYGPGGYAVPRQPIRVVLARDEEAAGIESVTSVTKPPAYGLWRESVRVDPNRLYWQRNDEAQNETQTIHEEGENRPRTGSSNNGERPRTARRPPSYASDDGITYILEAQPRSIAPTTDVPLAQHPAEAGRAGRPSDY